MQRCGLVGQTDSLQGLQWMQCAHEKLFIDINKSYLGNT